MRETSPIEATEGCRGLRAGTADPCLMVLFGASGDLAHRSLIPSLAELAAQNLLPDRFAVLGFARRDWDDDEYRRRMREAVEGNPDFDRESWSRLETRLHYQCGDFAEASDYGALAERIRELRSRHDLPDRVFFHLAAPPTLFPAIVGNLEDAGLATSDDGWRRLVVEKPFGEDRESARELDRQLRGVFPEEAIYRIDHFLGKETVQNMLVYRFANPGFEPVWNRDFVDHVQITVAEDLGIGSRASFYESTGVVRDMVQNHLLQLLCLTAVEPPTRFDARCLRDQTVQVLRAIRPPAPEDCVVGQYADGVVAGEEVAGYRSEEGVDDDSRTATFSAVKLELDSWRWADVPFYLRTGKRMARKLSEVAVVFKATPHRMFPTGGQGPTRRNVLRFQLQPDEGIMQSFVAKQPGPEICLAEVESRFCYADAFHISSPPRAYAWLILDVVKGDQTLFARSDWVDEAWRIVDPVVARSAGADGDGPLGYPAGSWGPEAARELIARDGRRWISG